MPTECLFREDSYLKDCGATVVAVTPEGGVVLDRTVFYAASGGQPADRGTLIGKSGDSIALANVVFTDQGKTEIAHVLSPGAAAISGRRSGAGGHRLECALRPHADAHRAASACPLYCLIR